jgi:hypothetical protein
MSNLWITPEELGEYVETEFAYEAAKSASNILWALSGRKYSGVTTVTERYVCATLSYRYGPSVRNNKAELVLGDIYNIPYTDMDSYTAVTTDGLSPQSRLRLRGRPVQKIHTIRNRSGAVVNPNSYYLVDHSTIQATAGSRWTPCDIEVTYTYGIEPPTLGKMAARKLAMEFAKLWNGDDDCQLPQRVTSISRQGVSYTLLDSQDFIDDMRTGLYEIDLFLKSVNPDKARARARVFTPDVPRGRRYTPKAPRLQASILDLSVKAGGEGSVDIALRDINAEFLTEELGWEPYVIVRNYAESASVTVNDCTETYDPTATFGEVVGKELTDNIATLTLEDAEGFTIGAEIEVTGVDGTFDGTYTISNVILSQKKISYERTASNVVFAADTGNVAADGDDRITITLTYENVLTTIGKVDPGTYDLYAQRDNGSEVETVYIGSGNLKVSLVSSVISAYTIGG